MTPKERAVMQQALGALEVWSDASASLKGQEAITALREALEVTEASISDHKSEQVMVSIDFMRHLEARFSYYGELVDGEWGNGRDIEELDAAHLLPIEVYQIRKILEKAPVFGFTQVHTSDKPLHHYALVLRDLDKTVDGWCEEPEFYLDGERLYTAPVSVESELIETNKALAKEIIELKKQAEQDPVGYFAYDEEHDIWEEMTGPNAPGATPLYASLVRTKDLADDEIMDLARNEGAMLFDCEKIDFARAVIAADREKNK